jgi:hypothetical protein
MTDQQYPITPPPELVEQWINEEDGFTAKHIATRAAQWGADQELEACCDHMRDLQWGFVERPDGTKIHRAVYLQQSRRPKPPTLNSIALQMLGTIERDAHYLPEITDTIRKALEQLRALESWPMTELFPSAQAVLNAFRAVPDLRDCPSIAAALRAAADQVVPSDAMEPRNNISMAIECQRIRAKLLAIAAELEGTND